MIERVRLLTSYHQSRDFESRHRTERTYNLAPKVCNESSSSPALQQVVSIPIK